MANLAREETDPRGLSSALVNGRSSVVGRRSSALVLTIAGATLAFIVAVLLGFLVPPQTLADEMSTDRAPNDVVYDPLEFTHGFYPPEKLEDGTTYEWTGPQATLTFPFAANLGRNAHVSVRLASAWAPGQQPATGSLLVNGKPVADFTTSKDFSTIEATIDTKAVPNPYLDPSHIQVDIKTSTSRANGDPRDLGMVVDWIRVEPERSRTEVLLEGVLWAIGVALVVFIASTRFGFVWGIIFGLGTLLTLIGVHLTYLPRGITPAVEAALIGLGWTLSALLAPKRWPAFGLPLAAAMIWMVVAGRVLGDWQMDDAYISYRYAWNLVHGHGLVYNVGEVVEGYTNFLWTLVAAAAIAAGLTPAMVTLALNIALSMGLLALTWHLAAKLSGGQYIWSLLAVALLVVDGSLLGYGARGSGMETILFSFLVLLSVALLWVEDDKRVRRWRAAAGLTLALAALTRPEGLLVAVVLLAVRALSDRIEGSGLLRNLAAGIGPFLLVIVPYEAWRISYYGYLFPNTFYAKTGTTLALIGRGWDYTGYLVTEREVIVALAAVGVVYGLVRWRESSLRLALIALLLSFWAYVIWAGGDYFPSLRFFLPLIAPLTLLAVEGARLIATAIPRHRIAKWVAAGVAVALGFVYLTTALDLLHPDSVDIELSKLHNSYVNLWGTAGLWLRDNTPPDATTAAKGAGAIAYFSDRRVIDVYGLNDLHIGHLPVADMGEGKAGHEKSDPAYVLDRKPDYIFEQWANYFDPIRDRLYNEYTKVSERSPTGPVVDWLVRK